MDGLTLMHGEVVVEGDLIVDSRHVTDVRAMLTTLGVPPRQAEPSTDLDLTLLTNLDLTDYLPAARERYHNEIAAIADAGRPFTGLDVLLYDLRTRFATSGGSVPVLGKNREADVVFGLPQHKHLKDPRPLPSTVAIVLNGDGAGAGVSIGVVDTPLARHELLPADVVRSDAEFVSGMAPVMPWAGHSTFVAGLIRQAAPGASIDIRKGLASDNGVSTTWELATKIASFRFPDITILNLSLGCVTADGKAPLLLRRALARLDPNILVVAAAGSRPVAAAAADGAGADARPATPVPLWPAAATDVVAVGAADGAFSADQPWVDCVAPGVDVLSTYLRDEVTLQDKTTKRFGGTASWTGTSFATATVSGLIAARMTTAGVDARRALELLLADPDSTVTRFHETQA